MIKINKRQNTEVENDKLFELSKQIFDEFNINCSIYIYLISSPYDITISVNDEIVGFYIFDIKSIFDYYTKENYHLNISKEEYINKKGIKGFFMGVLPEFQRMGLGAKMVEYVNETINKDFDYIWGGHFKILKNIDFWKKTRNIIGENNESFITILNFKNNIS